MPRCVVDTFARLQIATKKGGCPQARWSKSLGRVHGFGAEQPEDLVSMDLELSIFSLHMSLNRQSFDVDDAPCKLDGGKGT